MKETTNALNRLFADDGSLPLEAEIQEKKLLITEELLAQMEAEGMNRKDFAREMGVAPARVTSLLTGSNNFTLETLVRAARAVNSELFLSLKLATQQFSWDSASPGRTLANAVFEPFSCVAYDDDLEAA